VVKKQPAEEKKQDEPQLTPAQRMKLKKEMEI